MAQSTQFVLSISWDREDLPRMVGPFDTREEAQAWARLNVPNGSWESLAMEQPYAKVSR